MNSLPAEPLDPPLPTILDLNPDNLTRHEAGTHVGHPIRRAGPTRFECLTCKVTWRMVKNSVLARRKLLKR